MAYNTLVGSALIILALSMWHCQAGTITCLQPGRVYSCPADNCTLIGFVRAEVDYPCDCFVLRKPIRNAVTDNPKWYHASLPSGRNGYVNAFFCEGDVPHCKNR
ncbi:unnamed protein product [Adineta steineri]|uniref:Uncharacterized protein n=3 Tax=Adineta steineri TaxID=433720 RepID=A0A815UBX0_9BILA|nr:unnamed protein product [Adineta steineri]